MGAVLFVVLSAILEVVGMSALQSPVRKFFEGASPRTLRTFREFAEQEIRLPAGPRKNLRYTTSFMPFSREILDEFQRGRYQEFWGSGPVQASKTLHFFQIPAIYHLFELEEDVILGAPVQTMAKSAYLQRILPVIRKTRYRDLVPLKGPGARGGVPDLIQFLNGASLRFLGAGGGDHQIASYTARVVLLTETDKMDTAGKISRESDPVTKLIARTKAFGNDARVYAECTMSTPQGRIWRQVTEFGTDSRVFLPCVHCREWIWPERSGLVGWQEAPDELEARSRAGFQCTNCGKLWTEDDRRRSLEDPRVVARGQEVKDGVVTGPMPPTTAWGFRWNAMASPLTSIAAMAAEEWHAGQTGAEEDEKGVVQHVWAEPWEKKIEDIVRPDVEMILRKIVRIERGVIPPGTLKLTMGIDVGSYVIWWELVAWASEARGHVVDFDKIDVVHPHGQKDPIAILNALRTLRDKTVLPGWGGRSEAHADGHVPARLPDRILVDSGYEQDVVYKFVQESGEPRWLACRGFGTSSRHGGWHGGPAADPSKTHLTGPEWRVVLQPAGVRLVQVHSDYWKDFVHDGFGAAEGAAGSITVYHGNPKSDAHLRQFARQIVAEQREYVGSVGKEQKRVWVVRSKQNHWLDCMTYARCAADIEGIRLVALPHPASAPQAASARKRTIRTKY